MQSKGASYPVMRRQSNDDITKETYMNKPFYRRARTTLLGFALGLAILGQLFPQVAQAQSTPVRVGILPTVPVAPFFAALQEGYFKEEGLDVTVQSTQSGAVSIPGMVAGAFDIVYTNTPSVLQAQQQGIDLRIIAGGNKNELRPPEASGLVGLKQSNLRSGKDLEGKTVAVNVRNNLIWLFAREWVKKTGGDPDKVTYREVPFPQMLDALKAKQVDAAFAIEPFLSFGLSDPNLAIVAWPISTVAPGIQAAVYVMTAEKAAKHPAVPAKFLRALSRGAEWVKANLNKEPYLKLLSGYSKLDPKLIASMPAMAPTSEVDVASLKRMSELMREHGLLKSDIDPLTKILKR
jgi:NitT/TauT family transport system substrate-binding protein